MAFRMAGITLREEHSADLWRQRRAKRSRNVLTRLFRVDCNSQVALASAEQERSGSVNRGGAHYRSEARVLEGHAFV
jgi:hypothetical protein